MTKLKNDKASVKQRAIDACKLRCMGKSYDDIAKELGFASKGSAHKAVQKVLKDTVREASGELITMSTLELERLYQLYAEKAGEDPKYAKLLLEIYDRRVKLLNIVKEELEVKHEHKIVLNWDNDV